MDIGNNFIRIKPEEAYRRWVRDFIKKTHDMNELSERFNLFPEKGKLKVIKYLGEAVAEKMETERKSKN